MPAELSLLTRDSHKTHKSIVMTPSPNSTLTTVSNSKHQLQFTTEDEKHKTAHIVKNSCMNGCSMHDARICRSSHSKAYQIHHIMSCMMANRGANQGQSNEIHVSKHPENILDLNESLMKLFVYSYGQLPQSNHERAISKFGNFDFFSH